MSTTSKIGVIFQSDGFGYLKKLDTITAFNNKGCEGF